MITLGGAGGLAFLGGPAHGLAGKDQGPWPASIRESTISSYGAMILLTSVLPPTRPVTALTRLCASP